MIALRLLNPQGIAGLAAALILALLLIAAKVELRHERKASARFERLYRTEVQAHAATAGAVRAATERARAADRANAARVAVAQSEINERTADDYEARLAAARARFARLRPPAAPGGLAGDGRAAPVSGLSAAAPFAAQGTREDRFPHPDALIATEQAIQLDALIAWVRAQAAIDPNAPQE